MTEAFADEARRAWRFEARRLVAPADRSRLAALVLATGSVTVALVAQVMARRVAGADALGLAVSIALALGVALGLPLALTRRSRRRLDREIAEARARAGSVDCPRCARPLLARGPDVVARRTCGHCAAPLLEAEGLLVVDLADSGHRAARWSAAARHRLRHVRPRREGPVLWFATSLLGLAVLAVGARVAGVGAGSTPLLEMALGTHADRPIDGTARARNDDDEGSVLPVGPATRPRAPLWVGTQVLARRGAGPWHQLAVIVRVSPPSAFVVFADGDADWVGADGLLAPEIAVGDRVQIYDGRRYVAAAVTERLGPAVRADAVWTSMGRLRIRVDALHATGEGRESDVPLDAWVEAEVEPGQWRPGVTVRTEGLRRLVALSEGAARWFEHEEVRAQGVSPGAWVWTDDRRAPRLVAARVGHALALVDDRGDRGWAALSQVRRR
ncbi:MAG: hypothetical protein H6719_36860 [Sandaracinaceae bacterium]|nr:hypothetical protein [Sandaracinaceae bacterium]